MKIFYYRSGHYIAALAFTGLFLLLFGSLDFVVDFHGAPLFPAFAFLSMPILALFTIVSLVTRARPVAVTDERIELLFRGAPVKGVYWSEVIEVQKIRFYSTAIDQYRHEYRVCSRSIEIRFDDWLSNLPSLIKLINAQIAARNIPTYFWDRGRRPLNEHRRFTDTVEENGAVPDSVGNRIAAL